MGRRSGQALGSRQTHHSSLSGFLTFCPSGSKLPDLRC